MCFDTNDMSASSKALEDTVSVTLVEAGDLSKIQNWNMPPDAYSNRVSSLTNTTQAFLESKPRNLTLSEFDNSTNHPHRN